MRKAVVTYNFGDYDRVAPILWKSSDWDYYLFTDNHEANTEGYKRVVLDKSFFIAKTPSVGQTKSNTRLLRRLKSS